MKTVITAIVAAVALPPGAARTQLLDGVRLIEPLPASAAPAGFRGAGIRGRRPERLPARACLRRRGAQPVATGQPDRARTAALARPGMEVDGRGVDRRPPRFGHWRGQPHRATERS